MREIFNRLVVNVFLNKVKVIGCLVALAQLASVILGLIFNVYSFFIFTLNGLSFALITLLVIESSELEKESK
jgi:hypothetical protein